MEALDLPREAARPFKASAIETLERPRLRRSAAGPIPPEQEMTVSHNQLNGRPLKYHDIHIKRIPIRQHHNVVYGSAIHKAVEFYLRRRAAGSFFHVAGRIPEAFDDAWRNESRRSMGAAQARGAALTRFYHEEEASGQKPTDVESEFGFALGPTRVRGRLRRRDAGRGGRHYYKSSDVTEQQKADQRAKASLQLKTYCLEGDDRRMPAYVELRFLELGAHGRSQADGGGPRRGHRGDGLLLPASAPAAST